VVADGGWHPLADGYPPEWASAWGEDQFGIFVEFRVGEVDQRMRWIRPGKFMMGSPHEGDETQHKVTLTRGFWLADTPVTQALWSEVMGENPSRFDGDLGRPVEQVSWEVCQRFCATLHARVGGSVFRLPTEAEWEYACRAGTRAATYAPLDDAAWYSANSGRTHAVKKKLANKWGLHDMLGNVWEWCSDWHDRQYYSSSAAQQDPSGPATGEGRVIRGGSWGSGARNVRAAFRFAREPGSRSVALGLRLARDQE